MTRGVQMKQTIKNERNSGFELLRIVSAVMIVILHILGHGGLCASVRSGTLYYYIYWLVYALARVSTNCFVMLSGYYMVTSKIRASRIFRVECQVLFYSLLTYAIAVFFGKAFSPTEALKALTPVTSECYWFASAYIMMYLCIPFMNRIISGIKDKKSFRFILCVMLFVTSVIPTVIYWSDIMFVNGGYSFIWFITLYFIAAYIRLYGINVKKSVCLAVYLISALVVPFLHMGAEIFQAKLGATTFVDNMLDYKMPVTVIMTVAFFMLFKDFDIKKRLLRKLTLTLAPLSFGVYLLHDSDFTREILWDFVGAAKYSGTAFSLLYMAAVAAVIVIIGQAVDFIYQKLYKYLRFSRIEQKIDSFFAKVTK